MIKCSCKLSYKPLKYGIRIAKDLNLNSVNFRLDSLGRSVYYMIVSVYSLP